VRRRYDQAHGPDASTRSCTGRGRPFPRDGVVNAGPAHSQPWPPCPGSGIGYKGRLAAMFRSLLHSEEREPIEQFSSGGNKAP
jgi:hypothetical protein